MPHVSPESKKWEVEDAARVLMRAEEVKVNKPLFKAAKKELTEQSKAINKVVKGNKFKNAIGMA